MNNQKQYLWEVECLTTVNKKRRKNNITAATLAAFMILLNENTNKNYTPKRFWIDKILQERQRHGFYNKIFPVLQNISLKFINYFRMTATQFEDLLCVIGPRLYRQTFLREPVSPGERLCITLRYLSSGDMMSSLHFQYLRGLTTVSNIIRETCSVIWECLHKDVLPSDLKKENWLSIAKDFDEKWNFKNCIGAIDGKHVVIQCPNNAGSSFYNYKGSHSIVLLAVCDASYLFKFVDIGSFGRGSDSTVFRYSKFGQKFFSKQMNLPDKQVLSVGGPEMPYCLVGDEAFPLTDYLMRPYPGKSLTPEREIFNYRLSRARRTIENTFGILASQWRIFRRPIVSSVETAEKIVQACVCLHNWIREKEMDDDNYESPDMCDTAINTGDFGNKSSFQDIHRAGTNSSSRYAIGIRDEFCFYFNSEGAVPWQYDNRS